MGELARKTATVLLAAGWAVAAAEDGLTRPVAVPYASGPAFPQGRKNGNPPDSDYAAERAIDGDPESFCCLLDDTLTGGSGSTIPANGAAPVTGHMVFDLGQPRLVTGVRLWSRKGGKAYIPRAVDFFHYRDDDPSDNPAVCAVDGDEDINPLVAGHAFRPLGNRAHETVLWGGVVARYIGMRVSSSYESGPVHYNFQIAEIAFVCDAVPNGLGPGDRLPAIYAKQDTLRATLLATRSRLHVLFPEDGSSRAAQAGKLWEEIRRDFPPAGHALFREVDYGWFAEDGWLAREGETRLEEAFMRSVAEGGGALGAALLARLGDLVDSRAEADDPRWLQLCAVCAEAAPLVRGARSLGLAMEDLHASFPRRFPAVERTSDLSAIERRAVAAVRGTVEAGRDAWAGLRAEVEALKRRVLVTSNPLLSPGRLLFVKRTTYQPGWYYAEFMRASRFGGNLCSLSLPEGRVTELVPELAGGIFDRYDLSFDGERVVFAYKAAPGQGFRLYEVGVDGTGLRQLTFDPVDEPERIRKYWHPRNRPSGVYRHHTDDFHPCYLPDGGICFASTRCERGVLCASDDSLSVNVLYRMDADGSNLEILSENALSESTPSVMNDGRILYTRWEYVDKGVIAIQGLWSMRPDGTGTAEVYGNEIEFPPVLIHARAIPGRHNQIVCTATMHHPFAVGPILLLNTDRDIRTHEPIRSLTPDTSLSIDGVGGFPHGESYTHRRNGQWVRDNRGPLFSEPYPLAVPGTNAGAGTYFLVTCNPDQAWNHPTAYGLYLVDVFGNRVCVYSDPAISCWQPMPLRARARPQMVSPSLEPPAADGGRATVFLSDVYRGLTGVPRGTVKYLRILEQVPRPWSARRFWEDDTWGGQHVPISMHAHIFVKVHHGVVPVCEDGSAHFTVPADRSVFFQALDEEYMEVQRMRTFVNFQPGEVRGCVGCHEPHASAPPAGRRLCLHAGASDPGPQPGEQVPRPLHYPSDVQPVLDRNCVRCHSGTEPKGGLDLSGEATTFFCRSYETLMGRKLVAYIQEFHGPQPRAQKTNATPLPPYALGSHASKLVTHLRKGHQEVRLRREEMVRIITWADANCPYYGTYFGRRNILYRDRPDYRPVPTLASAWGWPEGSHGPEARAAGGERGRPE